MPAVDPVGADAPGRPRQGACRGRRPAPRRPGAGQHGASGARLGPDRAAGGPDAPEHRVDHRDEDADRTRRSAHRRAPRAIGGGHGSGGTRIGSGSLTKGGGAGAPGPRVRSEVADIGGAERPTEETLPLVPGGTANLAVLDGNVPPSLGTGRAPSRGSVPGAPGAAGESSAPTGSRPVPPGHRRDDLGPPGPHHCPPLPIAPPGQLQVAPGASGPLGSFPLV